MVRWCCLFLSIPNVKSTDQLPLPWPVQSWTLKDSLQMVQHLHTPTWKRWTTDRRVGLFDSTWQWAILPLFSCSCSISLKYLPSAHPFICGDNRARGFLLFGFVWRFAGGGMHNQSENQSAKQLLLLVRRWMAAMKSSLSALCASCATGIRFNGRREEGYRGGGHLLTFPEPEWPNLLRRVARVEIYLSNLSCNSECKTVQRFILDWLNDELPPT